METSVGPTLEIKTGGQEEGRTCDGVSEHRRTGATVIDGGDGHVILCLRDQAGQVQAGDVTVDLHLQRHSGASGLSSQLHVQSPESEALLESDEEMN